MRASDTDLPVWKSFIESHRNSICIHDVQSHKKGRPSTQKRHIPFEGAFLYLCNNLFKNSASERVSPHCLPT